MNKHFLVAILWATLCCVSTGQTVQPRQSYAVPALRPNEVWISSVPIGLKVYASDDTSGIISEKHFLGRSPLLLSNFKARYVAFALEGFPGALKPLKLPLDVRWQDFMDITAKSFTGMINFDAEGKGRFDIVHTYETDFSSAKILIGLFQPPDVPLDQLALVYPTGSNFKFDANAVQKSLMDEGVAQNDITQALLLLRRGGKVALQGKGGIIVAELADGNLFRVYGK